MSFLKKVILISFFTVFSTAYLWANSCPNLTGKFLCQNEGSGEEETLIHISQNTVDSVTSYFDADSEEVLSLLAINNIAIPFVTGQKYMIKRGYLIETTCYENAFIVHVSKDKRHPFGGVTKIKASYSRGKNGSLLTQIEIHNGGPHETQKISCPQVVE